MQWKNTLFIIYMLMSILKENMTRNSSYINK